MQMHPDLALLHCAARRSIGCLAVRDADGRAAGVLAFLKPFHCYRSGGETVLLFETEPDSLARAEDALTAAGLKAGFAGPFALPESARGCMEKAQLALETGSGIEPDAWLYPMERFCERALLEAVSDALKAQDLLPEDFIDVRLDVLARMDEGKNAQFCESLETYLRKGMNLREAAQTLGIHRNTLSYRISRIEDKLGLKPDDVNTCFELLFSFWLSKGVGMGRVKPETEAFSAEAASDALWRCVRKRDAHSAAAFECALVCVDVSSLADEDRNALVLHLSEAMSAQGAVCAFDEHAVFICCATDASEGTAQAATQIAQERKCTVVISQTFCSDRLAARVRLARFALCCAAGTVVRTEEIGSTLLFMALAQKVPLEPFLREDVLCVMDDDAQKGASLSGSLYAYLLYFCDMKRAAAKLHIHRNTMEYQLRKIEALIGKTPGAQERFLMMCTYKMLALPELAPKGL